ncbi:MAG: aminotransferase class V-fold PLP-dependent enzyme [Actinomycetota bacterium]|nr:aminotransferase class V-fold PLP-dependent enzyme [Actinomycetota bacterium]
MPLDQIADQFPGAPGYLNSASIGLPPSSAVTALREAIADWQAGQAHAPQYDADISEARALFAQLMSVPTEWVAIGSQVSALVSLAVTSLPAGSHVLCPEGEFTSVIFPFLARDDLDLTVEYVPLADLASHISGGVDMVAFSAVQSADGRVADLTAIREAAGAVGALTMMDATQAAGWLPLDVKDFDFVVAGAYKWLLSPRGTAFMTVRPQLLDKVRPLYAGWYAGDSPWDSIYGAPLRLATDARRLDLSPGWLAWVGTAHALRLLADVGVETIHHHNVGLANTLRQRVGLPPSDSAIVALDLDAGFDESRLDGLSTAYRAGRLRVGFHLYNTMDDVKQLTEALH